MDGLLEKISSYNIFNYLLPGSLFAVIADALTDCRLVQEEIVVGIFLYYFIGLVISRIGSVIVDPVLKKIKFVTFVDYKKFVEASKTDPKIDELSETNNMYRTLCALFLSLPVFVLLNQSASVLPWFANESSYFIGVALSVMFLFAYRKQTGYVVRRVNKAVEGDKIELRGSTAKQK